MEQEMNALEELLCPLLQGDTNDSHSLARSLEKRLGSYIGGAKTIQQDIENMVTKAEGMAHRGIFFLNYMLVIL